MDLAQPPAGSGVEIDPIHYVRIVQVEQCVEVAAASGDDPAAHNLALAGQAGVGASTQRQHSVRCLRRDGNASRSGLCTFVSSAYCK